jgi:hypothetical protein
MVAHGALRPVNANAGGLGGLPARLGMIRHSPFAGRHSSSSYANRLFAAHCGGRKYSLLTF